ncbi:putative serine protease K12H4.7 [Aphelenchoides fujianensis]|nr:putative serine protease K12H4.7 [Aphelenchoides fujianensis]
MNPILYFLVLPVASAGMGGFFSNKLDHFNKSDDRTFNQLFYYNDDYFETGSPELLIVGGMEEIHIHLINNHSFPINQYAKALKSRMWMLEHRFFGASQPFADQSADNLRFLSLEQAIGDLATFIRGISNYYSVDGGNWIVIGGDYGGLLALEIRRQHPELSLGAIASSAPFAATLDFYGYAEHSAQEYANYDTKCFENLRSGFSLLRAYMDNADDRAALDSAFDLRPPLSGSPLSDQWIQHFYSVLLRYFLVPVENNKLNEPPFDSGAGIADVCAVVNAPALNPIARLVKAVAYMRKALNETAGPLDIDYDRMVGNLRNSSGSDERVILWTKCTSFGRFPTTAFNQNPFGSLVQLNYYLNLCTDVFGPELGLEQLQKKLEKERAANREFGGTNTLVINHAVDPWSRLGAAETPRTSPSVHVLNLKTTGHCADLRPARSDDAAELTGARDKAVNDMQKWVLTSKKKKAAVETETVGGEQQRMEASKQERGEQQRGVPRELERVLELREHKLASKQDQKHVPKQPDHERPTSGSPKQTKRAAVDEQTARIFPDPEGDGNADMTVDGWYFIEQKTFAISFTNYAPGGPVFLALSGQVPAMTYEEFTDHTEMGYLAEEMGAMMLLLEHRGYGTSRITDDLTADSLRFLTIEQALADAVVFIRSVVAKLSLANPRFVTFGCALSAWLRRENPELTVGAVASSPLMLPKVDVFEYSQVVNESFAALGCQAEIAAAFAAVHDAFLTVDGRNQLNVAFSLCTNFTEDSVDERDRQTFFQRLIAAFFSALESSAHLEDLTNVCTTMTDATLPLLARLNRLLGFYSCLDWSYANQLLPFMNEDYDYANDGDRQWLWQRCTQLGLFPSTDCGRNSFGSSLPVEHSLEICSDVFGASFTRDTVEANVQQTLDAFGDQRTFEVATNLLVISGANDPWKALALKPRDSNDAEGITFLEIEDAGHCFDNHPPLTDHKNKPLFKKIKKHLEAWLQQ